MRPPRPGLSTPVFAGNRRMRHRTEVMIRRSPAGLLFSLLSCPAATSRAWMATRNKRSSARSCRRSMREIARRGAGRARHLTHTLSWTRGDRLVALTCRLGPRAKQMRHQKVMLLPDRMRARKLWQHAPFVESVLPSQAAAAPEATWQTIGKTATPWASHVRAWRRASGRWRVPRCPSCLSPHLCGGVVAVSNSTRGRAAWSSQR